ncbi:restriction endonuclease subunit S [Gemmiger sp.]
MKESIKKRIEAVRRGEVPEGYVSQNHQLHPVDWKYEKIGKYLVPYDEFSNDTEAYPLATSSRRGLMLQSEYYKDQRYEETSGGFHVVPEGYVTYRHMSDDDIFCFNVNRMGSSVLVSPEYPVFTTSDGLHQGMLISYLNNMKAFKSYCSAQKKGSTRTRMYFSRLGEFAMPIPPVNEQQKIAEILATCDRLIELKQSKIDELKKLKQVCLLEMFPQKGQTIPKRRFPGFSAPWEQRKLGEVSESYSGGTPSVGVKEYYGGEIPFIRSAEINSEITELFLTEEGLKNSSARLVAVGDILYALYGATSGEVGRARLKGAINQAILAIKPHTDYDSEYLAQWLQKSKHSIIETYLQGGQGNLSATIVKELSVDFPSLKEQQAIGDFFSQLDHLITLHQRELAEVGKYKKALMQLLLTGLVRVNV